MLESTIPPNYNYRTYDHHDGDVVVDYYPPQRRDHRYVYEIYKQKGNVRKTVPKITPFDIDKYVKNNSLVRYTTLTVTTNGSEKIKHEEAEHEEAESEEEHPEEAKIKYHGFVKGLTGPDAKYCTCIIEAEYKKYKGGGAYNPYAVCTKSTGGHVRSCGEYYDYDVMPLEYLLVFADKHKISVRDRNSRGSALNAIRDWKAEKSHM
jgi:hypothetical protein